ncbi:Glu-tRNA(Gln) amidotransferase subunit GatE [Candidatus Pacearchaeota archaeon]|nr:Glu-tRNA(Gln) amidotransferase subunit GatE [Candidatus Pacearchaeota archaeon]
MDLDYSKIGLKCGLEIHQQLDTRKLFCNCPSLLRKDEPDFKIKRKLHAVAGQSGEVDEAAIYQVSLDKNFIYEGYDSTCLVELDESPPLEINKDALKIAMQISILLNAKIFPLTQIMRKTVIDGSNTSGFQRTVLIARDGFVETKFGKVGIESICLEEDSARIIQNTDKESFYRLDRLGIPLVEIATAPDIKNPQQAKEVALHIGKILRLFKVKRGLGTIRQDVNVSIKKGARVEIKGVQKPELIEKSVELEAKRQLNLIEKKQNVKSEVRKVLPSGETEFLRPMPGASRMYPETDLPLLKISRAMIDGAKKNLPELKDESEELLKLGLNHEMIKLVLDEEKIEEFKEIESILKNPRIAVKILITYPKEIASKEKIPPEKSEEIFDYEILKFVAELVAGKKISEEQIKNVFERIANGETKENAIKFEKSDANDAEEKIRGIIKEKPGLSENAYMGLVMSAFKGKISGKEVMEIIKKYAK